MRRAAVSAVGLLAGLACHAAPEQPKESVSARATAAIQALVARDADAVAQCQRAVDACNANVPDAAGSGVCARLADRCAAIQDRLAKLRGPAEGCWRAADACERAPEQAQCSRDVSLCEALDGDSSSERDKTLECEARVQACLVRASSLPDAALVACENMAAACDRVAENRAGKGDAGASSGDDSSDDDSSGDDSSGDDEGASDGGATESDDSSGDDDGDGNPGRPDRPPAGHGHDRAADAGVDTAN